jgi:hypothetical protein
MSEQKPSVGRIVLVKNGQNHNGSIEHPAVINRVWSDSVINVTLLPDNTSPYPQTSVCLESDPDAHGSTWRWPPRV